MFFGNPRRKLDAKLQTRVAEVARGGRQRRVRVTVECRKGAEAAVAEAVRERGGKVYAVLPVFRLVSAEVSTASLIELARSPQVREVNLASVYGPA